MKHLFLFWNRAGINLFFVITLEITQMIDNPFIKKRIKNFICTRHLKNRKNVDLKRGLDL